MMTTTTQRWRLRRGSYRPADEVIEPLRYELGVLEDDTTAKRFIADHHYAGTYPAARRRFGLYRSAELVGVAVFSVPPHPKVITNCLPGEPIESLELGRFVLLDEVPANGETWFLARCFAALRAEGFVGVVSFSDPMQRLDGAGQLVHGGHVGTIYQAHNAVYLGQARRNTIKLLPDGRVLSNRTLSKLRTGARGWRAASELLQAFGAEPIAADASELERRRWVTRWTKTLTRTVRHPGNHKYVWALQKRVRRHLPAALPYPKLAA